jgi:trigger factor
LGHDAICHEALDSLIPEVYREAVDQEEIDPVESPDVEISSTEPLVVKATVPVRPTIQLADYESMRLPREPILIPEERVDEIVEELRHRYANLNPVDRPLQWNDALRADITVNLDGRVLADQKDTDFAPKLDSAAAGACLKLWPDRGITMREVEVPEDFGDRRVAEDVAGQAHIHEVKRKSSPPDDAFARR